MHKSNGITRVFLRPGDLHVDDCCMRLSNTHGGCVSVAKLRTNELPGSQSDGDTLFAVPAQCISDKINVSAGIEYLVPPGLHNHAWHTADNAHHNLIGDTLSGYISLHQHNSKPVTTRRNGAQPS